MVIVKCVRKENCSLSCNRLGEQEENEGTQMRERKMAPPIQIQEEI